MGEPRALLLPVESAGAGVMGSPGRQQGPRLVAGKGGHFLRSAQPLSTGSPLAAPGRPPVCWHPADGAHLPGPQLSWLLPGLQEVVGALAPGSCRSGWGVLAPFLRRHCVASDCPHSIIHPQFSPLQTGNTDPWGMGPAPVGGRMLGGDQPHGCLQLIQGSPSQPRPPELPCPGLEEGRAAGAGGHSLRRDWGWGGGGGSEDRV